eukprot:UC1_evm2s351
MTIWGLYAPPKSVPDKPHNNVTSRRFTYYLKSDNYDWIDAVAYAPQGTCKEVNLDFLQDQIIKDKTLFQDGLRRVLANHSKCVYVAGWALNTAVRNWISDISAHEPERVTVVDTDLGTDLVYVDDMIFIMGRKHPSAHLYGGGRPECYVEIRETAMICQTVMEMDEPITEESFEREFAKRRSERVAEKVECVRWFCAKIEQARLPVKLKHWVYALTRKNRQSALDIVRLIGTDAASHIPAFALSLGEMLLKSLNKLRECEFCVLHRLAHWKRFMCGGVASAVVKDCDGFIKSLNAFHKFCALHKLAHWETFMCNSVASALAKDCEGFIKSLNALREFFVLHKLAHWETFMCDSVASALAKDCEGFIKSLDALREFCDLHELAHWETFMCNSVASALAKDCEGFIKSLDALREFCDLHKLAHWETFICGSVASALAKDGKGFITSLNAFREFWVLRELANWQRFICDSVASALAKDGKGFIKSLEKVEKVCDLRTPANWKGFMCNSVAYALAKDGKGFIKSLKKVGKVCHLREPAHWQRFMRNSVASAMMHDCEGFIETLASIARVCKLKTGVHWCEFMSNSVAAAIKNDSKFVLKQLECCGQKKFNDPLAFRLLHKTKGKRFLEAFQAVKKLLPPSADIMTVFDKNASMWNSIYRVKEVLDRGGKCVVEAFLSKVEACGSSYEKKTALAKKIMNMSVEEYISQLEEYISELLELKAMESPSQKRQKFSK